MTDRVPPYARYASHYDQIGQREFSLFSIKRLLGLLAEEGRTPCSALDLACGTGAAAILMANAGIVMTGLDFSSAMLEVAKREAAAESVDIKWIEADMAAFALDEPVDLVTCFYDAVNYLASEEELHRFLRCSLRALRPGGTLAFDINTKTKLVEHWGDSTIVAADDKDRFLVYQSWFDDKSASSPLRLTGFERQSDGTWLRFDEEHVEYAYAIETIIGLLAESGFADIDVLEWGNGGSTGVRPGSESCLRVLFRARRPIERGSET